MKNNYYVYEHWRPDQNVCFYVGKGKDNRFLSLKRSRHHINIVNLLRKNGFDVVAKKVRENLTEPEAYALEIELIAKYGRRDLGTGTLINRNAGGVGGTGQIFTEETKEKIRQNTKLQWQDENFRKKISDAAKNKKMSPEARKKISDALKGRPKTKEHAAKAGAARKGKKNKRPSLRKGKPQPIEWTLKMIKTKTGVPWSAARRAAYERTKHTTSSEGAVS